VFSKVELSQQVVSRKEEGVRHRTS